MSSLRFTVVLTIIFSLSVCTSVEARAKRKPVEAVKGKRYLLHHDHDPWMIMVTSLRDVDPLMRSQGMSAWDAADALIYELRQLGIPAYAYHQKEQIDKSGGFVARQEYIAILAGGFDSPDSSLAQKVLKYIQNRFNPEMLRRDTNGAILPKGKGDTQPFRRAFIAPNPLRSKDELGTRAVDPLIVQLNSGSGEISLLKNPGKFSLKVATFSGGTVVQVAGKEDEDHLKYFNENFGEGVGKAGVSAWELATALRQAARLGYAQNYEAWVYHDKYKSYVTIGSFEDPNDPRLEALAREFEAKYKPNPQGNGRNKLTPELFSIPKNPRGQTLPDKLWFFDQKPRVIAVPGK